MGTSFQEFQNQVAIRTPLHDLNSVLDRFNLYYRIINRPEIIERVAKEAVEDCDGEGTRRVELRYDPNCLSELSGLSWEIVLQSILKGLEEGRRSCPNIEVGLICIAARNIGIDGVARVCEFYKDNIDYFVGIDLANDEVHYPSRLFESSFRPIRKLVEKGRAHITIHSGEDSGPENVWESIELLGAQRIGHGVRSIEDPQLVNYLVENKIPLEVCVTSNWLVGLYPRIEDHALPNLLNKEILCTINTDDPAFFDTTLPKEIEICRKRLGLSDEQIQQCFETANRYTFLNRTQT